MKPYRSLIIVAVLIAAVFVVISCSSPTPVLPTSTPANPATPFNVTPAASPVSLDLPTLTPTPQPTPLPTKPRPGYTPIPDDVVSPVVVDQSPVAGEEAKPDGTIQL